MKMYDEGNIGIAITSGFVETHAGDLHVYADRTQAGNMVFITTDNFKKYIPIEWIKKYIDKRDANLPTKEQYVPYDLWEIAALELLIDTWEAENGRFEKSHNQNACD